MKAKLIALFATLMMAISVQAANFKEGEHYIVYSNPIKVSGPTVTEYFSYNCPSCYRFYPNMTALKAANKGDKFKLEEVPVGFGRKDWQMAQKAYVYKKVLKLGDATEKKIFNRIHGSREFFRSDADLKEFFVAEGVDPKAYDKKIKSFTVKTSMKKIEKRIAEGRVSSVPTVLVNGKYAVDIGKVTSPEKFVELVDYLLAKK